MLSYQIAPEYRKNRRPCKTLGKEFFRWITGGYIVSSLVFIINMGIQLVCSNYNFYWTKDEYEKTKYMNINDLKLIFLFYFISSLTIPSIYCLTYIYVDFIKNQKKLWIFKDLAEITGKVSVGFVMLVCLVPFNIFMSNFVFDCEFLSFVAHIYLHLQISIFLSYPAEISQKLLFLNYFAGLLSYYILYHLIT